MLEEPLSAELIVSMRNHFRLAVLTLFQIAWLLNARALEKGLLSVK
jgi:hypothetical protein